MSPLVDTSGVLWFANELAGYVRFRRSMWEPDRFKALLVRPSGLGKRLSRRSWAKAQQAIRYRFRVQERIQRRMANRPKEQSDGEQGGQ
jgi:hypothetical protein